MLFVGWSVAVQAATPQVTFRLSSHTNQPGETVSARVSVSNFTQVTSAQFTLQWDPTVARFLSTGGYSLSGLANGNFGTALTNLGKLTFSWDDQSGTGVTVADGGNLFTVNYQVAGDAAGRSSPLALTDAPTLREVAVNFDVATFVSLDGLLAVPPQFATNAYAANQTNFITINDDSPATPYPSLLAVSNLTGVVSKATVTLHGFSHAWPSDVGVLLVGPQGQRIEIMADAGSSQPVAGLTLTFDDDAVAGLSAEPLLSQTYRPGPCGIGDTFAPPAPAGPYATALSSLAGADPNGVWALYVQDDAAGDAGNIGGGWTLNLLLSSPSPAPVFVPGMLTHFANGQFQFQLTGLPGAEYEIQASADLRNWKVLKTFTLNGLTTNILDLNSNVVQRFYRARWSR